MSPLLASAPHPAAPYLHRLATNGVPAPSAMPPWLPHQRFDAIARGPHPSASAQFSSFILEDMLDYVNMGYWVVLPYTAVSQYPHLKLAPAGVVPQRERRPRPIMDYSFNLVNQASIPIAPVHAMQFGSALQRFVQRLVYANPKFGPPLMAKIDLADGYYRVPLSPEAALELAVVLPPDNTEANLVGIPLSLPMGWANSPPYFCAFTETGADIANMFTEATDTLAVHPMESALQTLPMPTDMGRPPMAHEPHSFHMAPNPLQYVDVYIDDFIAAAQRPSSERLMRCLLHSIDTIFQDPPHSRRRHILSASKIAKGDAAWSYSKRILGWDIDTQSMTLHLPSHRQERLLHILLSTLQCSRISRRKWMVLLGELRSMAAALHSTKHLFSILQHALVDQAGHRLRITPLIRRSLQDWVDIASTLAEHPMPLAALVPMAPTSVGATDASKQGMGGFWLPTTMRPDSHPPMVWRAPFTPDIQARLVSTSNPTGSITNSDLELTALITGAHLAASLPSATRPSLYCAVDNTPALAWTKRGSTSSIAPPAYLLRQLAQSCRQLDFTLYPLFTPGSSNLIADFCSRSFALSDDAFLRELQRGFPIQPSWTLVHPTTDWRSLMNSALFRQMRPWASPSPEVTQPRQHGTSGMISVPPFARHPTCRTLTTPSPSSWSLLADTEQESLLPVGLQFALERWKTPFVPWARRWPHWDA